MAIPQGNYAAYKQTVNDSKLELGQFAKDVAQQEKDREAKKVLQAQERAKKQQEIATNFGQDYNTLADVVTGTKSIDEAFARGIGKARDLMGTIYKSIQTNPSLANDVNTQMKLQNLRNYSKTLKTSSDRITEFNTKLAAGVQDGSLSDWNSKYLNIADSIYRQSNLDIGVNADGMPIGATILVDNDGEPILDEQGGFIVEPLSLPQIMQGNGLPELVPQYNLAADAQAIGKDLAKRTKESVTGGFSTSTVQTWDSMKEDARALVKSYLGDSKNPSAEAKSIWTDIMGNEPKKLDANDLSQIEEVYLNSIKPFYDSTLEQDIDFNARNAAIKENNRVNEKKAEEDKNKAVSNFTVITDQDGTPQEVDLQGVSGDLSGKATAFSLPVDPKTKKSTVKVTGPSGSDVVISRVFLVDDGELAYEGFEYKSKSTGLPVGANIPNLYNYSGKLSKDVIEKGIGGGMSKNDNVLTSVAKYYGLNNEKELKELLKKKKETYNQGGKSYESMSADEKKEYLKNKYK